MYSTFRVIRIAATRGVAPKVARAMSTVAGAPPGLAKQGDIMVSNAWLAKYLSNVRIIDASWFVPSMAEDPRANYLQQRVPGAQFFDIDQVADKKTDLPHMFPSAEEFAEVVGGQMGISEKDTVVVYDSKGIFSSPRVWFTFKLFGAKDVRILGGGLPAWRREGFSMASGPAAVRRAPTKFVTDVQPNRVVGLTEMKQIVSSRSAQIVDARSIGRFEGLEAETRPGLRSGHIPTSVSVPFTALVDDYTGALKAAPLMQAAFRRGGVDLSNPDAPIVTTCGSGITAAFLCLGLELSGHRNYRLYDGSWAEWGRTDVGTPISTGSK